MLTDNVDDMHEVLPSGAQSQEDGVIASEERRSLESALSTLSVDDREVLSLYYVQKRTTKEIAVVMGVAPGTIMARLFRAREKLRKRMTAESEEVAR
jgi:RNA polymerase sigma-70 factor (ECF subfamily)